MRYTTERISANMTAFLKKYLIVVGALVLGIGVGYVSAGPYAGTPVVNEGERHLEPNQTGLTNPLLECDLGAEYLSENSIRPFRSKIQETMGDLIGGGKANHVSYYFRDLNNGSWFGINEKEIFSPASLLKVPLLIHILKSAEQDPAVLEAQIEYASGESGAPQFIMPENSVKAGGTYPVRQLLEYMVIESDNNAALLLTQFVGLDKFQSIFKDLGLSIPSAVDEIGSMSVRDYATFFRVLFNASYLNRSSSEGALALLTQTKFREGIRAGVPGEILVAHKFGEREFEGQKQLHDCGIVYTGKNPYLLCIMTRGDNFAGLVKSIAELSKVTYEEVRAQIQ